MKYIIFILVLLICEMCFADSDFPIPKGYVLQRLDATDGKIAKPKNWFYNSSGTSNGWVWTFSEEDTSKGEYETGLRLQLIVEVKKNMKQSPEDFAKGFLNSKKNGISFLKPCDETIVGDFIRQCLETVEKIPQKSGTKAFHILYSVFWSNNRDMVVVSTFGAPVEKWDSVKSISSAMSYFELIGPNVGNSH